MLEPRRSPQEYHTMSPVLFWTIIAIAARQNRDDPDLLGKLKPLLDEMLWKMIANNPTHLQHIQVMVLWSCWPLPNLRFWTDHSISMISVALHHAMQLGLHRPGFENDFTRMGFFLKENVLQDEHDENQDMTRRVFKASAWYDKPEHKEAIRYERTRTWVALVAMYQKYERSHCTSEIFRLTG